MPYGEFCKNILYLNYIIKYCENNRNLSKLHGVKEKLTKIDKRRVENIVREK